MANFSNFLENKIIDHMLRAQSYTPPATVYVALFTGNAAAALEANNPTTEVPFENTGYVRKALALDEAASGATANTSAIEWDAAEDDWGTITHFAVVDHATNVTWGDNVNVLMWGQLIDAEGDPAPKTVNKDDVIKFGIGKINIELD